MDAFFVVSRLLFAAVFVVTPAQVMAGAGGLAGHPTLRRLPAPALTIIATSIVSIIGAVMVILGVWPDLGVIFIAIFLIPVSIAMHPFWSTTDPVEARKKRDAFLLNMSVLGGGLMLFWFVNQNQHVPAGLVSSPLFSAW